MSLDEEPRALFGRFGPAVGEDFPQGVVGAGPVAESDDELVPIAAAVGILHDLEAGQLVGIARVGTGQIPRATGDADAEDGQVLGILGNAKGVGGRELAIYQIGDPVVVGAAPAELEVALGLVAISGSDDSELPIVLAENFVGAEADRVPDPLHLEGTSVRTVDVGTRPGLVVLGIAGSVGIILGVGGRERGKGMGM